MLNVTDSLRMLVDSLTQVISNKQREFDLDTSDWVLVITTLILAFVALFVPYFAEILKRNLFKPKIESSFLLAPPYCHLTSWSNLEPKMKPLYYFRFQVKNTGKSTLRNCEKCSRG